jgi:hypothetical protein
MQQRLLVLRGRFGPVHPDGWGPGRVDTFNASKAYFNFPFASLPDRELHGAAEFPSIWNQGKKRGMQLHWDGNNDDVVERNKNAAFGTGTTPATVDLEGIGRIETWLWDLKPPPYPYPIDKSLASRGSALYRVLRLLPWERAARISPASTSARSRRSSGSRPILSASIPSPMTSP